MFIIVSTGKGGAAGAGLGITGGMVFLDMVWYNFLC